jgi:hypothetical protein
MIYSYAICESATRVRVKLGKAVDPERRVGELQTGNPNPLVLLAVSNKITEAELHRRYEKYNVLNEWYELPMKEFIELISEMTTAEIYHKEKVAAEAKATKEKNARVTALTTAEAEAKLARLTLEKANAKLAVAKAVIEDNAPKQCKAKIKSGERKGQPCGNKALASGFCGMHE